MASDFGLLVGRYNVSTPNLATDNALHEVRLDVAGRVYNRLADGNDNTPSYFADGDAVGSGVGNSAGTAGDRGLLFFGKDYTDSIYKPVKINSDGSLVVATDTGTDASQAADKTNTNDGQVALTSGTWVLVENEVFNTGHFHVTGWSYASDKNTLFQLALTTSTATPVRTDITEILDSQITSSARPSDHVTFGKSLDRAGGTNHYLTLWAKQLQAGTSGVALSMFNVYTTT